MRWTIFGRSPLPLAIAYFVVVSVAFVVVMNRELTPPMLLSRWVLGVLTAFGAADLSYRLNHYRWK